MTFGLGVGLSSAASADELADLVDAVLSRAGLSRTVIALVGTVDRLASDPRVLALDLTVRGFTRETLAEVSPSVCEAAAVLAVPPPANLLVAKVAGPHSTVAVACSAPGRPAAYRRTAGRSAVGHPAELLSTAERFARDRSVAPWLDSRSFF